MSYLKRQGRGFTLAEMMLTLALVALVYTMVSTILIQISRYVKAGREVARERYALLKTVEDLRYQLRSLYVPGTKPGLVGKRTPLDGQDSLQFLTTNGNQHKGVIEATYLVQEHVVESREDQEKNGSTSLYYREFPFRSDTFRTLNDYEIAPWKVQLKNVKLFEIEYSATGRIFQREWTEAQPPSRIRLRIARGGTNRDRIVFDVTPGVGAGRW